MVRNQIFALLLRRRKKFLVFSIRFYVSNRPQEKGYRCRCWSQTWTLGREQTIRQASMAANRLSASARLNDWGSARNRDAEKAALAMASSGDAMPAVLYQFECGCVLGCQRHIAVEVVGCCWFSACYR